VYPGFSFLTARPGADVIFAIAIGVLILKAMELRRVSRKEKEALAAEIAHIDDAATRAEAIRHQQLSRHLIRCSVC